MIMNKIFESRETCIAKFFVKYWGFEVLRPEPDGVAVAGEGFLFGALHERLSQTMISFGFLDP